MGIINLAMNETIHLNLKYSLVPIQKVFINRVLSNLQRPNLFSRVEVTNRSMGNEGWTWLGATSIHGTAFFIFFPDVITIFWTSAQVAVSVQLNMFIV